MDKPKVDLTLIKRLVSELEHAVDIAEKLQDAGGNKNDWIIELNKASGLASGIVGEGAALIGDMQVIIQGLPVGAPGKGTADLMSKLMGSFKAPGGSN